MKRIHAVVGIVGLMAFIATGQYMDRVHDHLRQTPDVTRLLFRSTHIYLLLASIINLALGLYLSVSPIPWRRGMQRIGSLLLLAGPPLLLAGFSTEPWLSDLARPYTRPAIYGALAGIHFHLVANLGAKSDDADALIDRLGVG